MRVSKYFNREEFDCRDGTPVPDNLCCNVVTVANQLDVIREELGKPIFVLSGYRTPKYNKAVGGATQSQHLKANASDIVTKFHTPKQIHAAIEKLIKEKKIKNGGLGLYKTFVHYDIGPVRRWNG